MSYEPYPTSPPPSNNPYGTPPSTPPGQSGRVGFFKALFDLSFTHFITPKIVRAVYVLGMIGIGVAWLIFTVGAFHDNAAAGVLVLVFGALVALVYLAIFRMMLEFYVAVTRMSEDIHKRLPYS